MSWSKEAEQSALGACLLDELAFEHVASKGLKSGDFHHPAHRLIYAAIEKAANSGNGIDVVTVMECLTVDSFEGIGGAAEYLSYLVDVTPAIENAGGYAEIIKQRSSTRRLRNLGDTIGMMIGDGSSTDEVQDYIGSSLIEIATDGSDNRVYEMKDALTKAIDRLDELENSEVADWSTGLADLDDKIRPESARIYAIIGDTGSGKTTLAQTIAEGSLKSDIPVYYASMEMPVEQMTNRFISSAGNVNRAFLSNPKRFAGDKDEQWRHLTAGVNVVKSYPLTIDATPSQKSTALAAKVRAWARKERGRRDEQRAMLVVDYLGLMDMPGKDLVNELGEASKALKVLANELNICIIMLAQVNREISKRPNKRPLKSDIRDSGKVENDMDAVIAVYRDEYYDENSKDKGIAEVIVRKSRDGELGTAHVRSELHYSRFSDLQINQQ